MWYRAYFAHGVDRLDISAGNYYLSDFVPPSANDAPILGGASTFNRREGSGLADVIAENFYFDFTINIVGTGQGEIKKATDDLINFIKRAGDAKKPLYLCYRPHDYVNMEPISGQWNASVKLVVEFGSVGHSDKQGDGDLRTRGQPDLPVRLNIRPYPLGGNHLFAQARGGVYSAMYPKRTDGLSAGTRICPATVNLIPNPSAEVNTTGWTNTGCEIFERSTKESLFGSASFRLFDSNSAGSGEYMSSGYIPVSSSTVYSCSVWVKKTRFPGAPAASKLTAWTFTSAPALIDATSYKVYFASGTHDWTRYSFTFTTEVNCTQVIIVLALSESATNKSLEIFADGFMLEQKPYASYYGDGTWRAWTWASTAHSSASTRTAGQLYYDWINLLNVREGTICIVWTPDFNSSVLTDSVFIFDSTSSPFLRWYQPGSNWQFNDGSFVINSATTTFTAGQTIVFHIVYSSTGIQLYVNGVSVGSDSGHYSTEIPSGYLFWLGSDKSATQHSGGVYHLLTTYATRMTSIEVTADYNNLVEIADGRRIDCVSFYWGTSVDSGGDLRLYNSNDDAARTNFVIACEVPGAFEAQTQLRIDLQDNILGTASKNGVFFSRLLTEPSAQLARFLGFFGELSGSADANSSGGAYERKAAVSTTGVAFTKAITITDDLLAVLAGQEIALISRMRDPSAVYGVFIAIGYQFGADMTYVSPYKTVVLNNTSFASRLTRFITFRDITRGIENAEVHPGYDTSAGVYLFVKRTTGSDNMDCDYYQIVTKPTLFIWSSSAAGSNRIVLYDSKTGEVINVVGSTNKIATDLIFKEASAPFELVPNKDNYIIYAPGNIKSVIGGTFYDDTIAFEEIKVVPRWGIA